MQEKVLIGSDSIAGEMDKMSFLIMWPFGPVGLIPSREIPKELACQSAAGEILKETAAALKLLLLNTKNMPAGIIVILQSWLLFKRLLISWSDNCLDPVISIKTILSRDFKPEINETCLSLTLKI